ncbi:TonB-dependent receptor [Pedobacter sp. MC2016-05]|uniref:SusC/RagA family TonB-linked outer membrane protein n=1 Tax=Pedobacter sp. MC2016-05 TaxID=2994474 RepID=UPI00224653B9|nr:TonB-dependent receptor [Pedobacter sp. MC2016-05]MCX2473482.1 TonB-dependent receptor [Pedobacter sp. MC2016-05]
MKLTLLLIVAFNFQLFAAGYAQSRVSLDLKSVDFKRVASEVEKKTKYRFLFGEFKIPTKKFDVVNAQNEEVLTLVTRLLEGTSFTYRHLENDLIVIVPRVTENLRALITGKVLDETGQPMVGVTIKIKGVEKGGSITDANGAFRIDAPDNAVLTIAYIGYITQEIIVGDQETLTIRLKPSAGNLTDVVVVGYGTQRKSDVTGAISSVNSSVITRAATTDATGALQGQTPGAVVVKNVGKPGSGYSVSIRGTSSFTGANSPLLVIDGIPTTSGLNDINPADIEKMDVLKDASATAIYGSRGAKGVVIITTKRGKAGKTTITYDGYLGSRRPNNLPEFFDATEYRTFLEEQYLRGRGATAAVLNALPSYASSNTFTDWPGLVQQNGLQMNHNLAVSGGDDKTRFSFGAGLLREEGNVSPEDFKRYSFRGSIDRTINNTFKAGISFYANQNLQNLGSSEALRSAYRLPATVSPNDAAGNPVFRVLGADGVTNPLFDQLNDLRENRNYRMFGNLYLQVDPVKYISFRTSLSPNFYRSRNGTFFDIESKEGAGNGSYRAGTYTTGEQLTLVWTNQLTYERTFNNVHKITATAVSSVQNDRSETGSISAYNLPFRSLWYNLGSATNTDPNGTFRGPTVTSNYIRFNLVSNVARVNYSFRDKYLLTVSGTADGSSRLSEGNKWGFFPSASLAWRASEETFIKNISAISNLKFRLSYGKSGNDRVNPYDTQATLGSSSYYFGSILALGYSPNRLANQNLTWETTKEINFGIDFGFFNNRISGSIDMYDRKIDNIIGNRPLPPPAGFSSVMDNLGKLRNRGLEVGLNTINLKLGKFTWMSDFVLDINSNKVLETANGQKDDLGSLLFIGHPVLVNYDYEFEGIWQTNEAALAASYGQRPGQVRVKDRDGNGVINTNDRQIIGKRIPSWTGSFGNTFKYGNLDLYVLLYTRQGEQFNSSFDGGFKNYNQVYNQLKVDYWTATNPSQTNFQPGNPGPFVNAIYYQKTNFLRVNNVTLGYTFPKKLVDKVRLSSVRMYATANNPLLFTDYQGFDPEWASQNTYGTAISTSTYLFGLNIGI